MLYRILSEDEHIARALGLEVSVRAAIPNARHLGSLGSFVRAIVNQIPSLVHTLPPPPQVQGRHTASAFMECKVQKGNGY